MPGVAAVKRNPLQSAIGALLAVGLIVSASMLGGSSTPFQTAGYDPNCGYGYDTDGGSGYAYGYGTSAGYAYPGGVCNNDFGPQQGDLGYRFVASDGGVFNFGDRTYYGSAATIKLNQPIVGGAQTASGKGYWLVASDGGVFSYGDAQFYGSTGNIKLNKPVVGIQPTPSGKGYWLVASDGGVFSYGDAVFHGSAGAIKLNPANRWSRCWS